MADMDWGEFCSLLAGINGETALGNIVRIRSEKNVKTIKNFSPEEKRIRNEWLSRKAKQVNVNSDDYKMAMEGFKNMFKSLEGKEAKKNG